MNLPIDNIIVNHRFRRDLGDISSLAASIAEVGLLHPVVIDEFNNLIAGQRRLEAVKLLGWEDVPVTRISLDEIVHGEYAENAYRKDFTPSEMVAISKAIKPVEAERARERQGERNDLCENFAEVDKGRTVDKVGAFVGVSGRTLEKAEAVVDSGDEKLIEMMDNTSVHKAYKELNKRKRIEEVKQREELPDAKYRVLYADPPWKYGEEQHGVLEGQHTVLENHYPTMSIEELCRLRIADLADEHAVLFLWVTSPFLEKAFDVIRAWGFRYKTSMVWDKVGHNVGNYVSVRHEFLLICTRGICTPDNMKLFDSVQTIDRTEHSKKPEVFREIIDTLYPHGKRIELFARETPERWDAWGNEVA